jgi:hypothetical protein
VRALHLAPGRRTNLIKGDADMSEMGKTHIVIMRTVGPDDVAGVIVSSRLTPSG